MKPKEIKPAIGLYDQMQDCSVNYKHYEDFSLETLIDFAKNLQVAPISETMSSCYLSGKEIEELYPGEYSDLEENKVYILTF